MFGNFVPSGLTGSGYFLNFPISACSGTFWPSGFGGGPSGGIIVGPNDIMSFGDVRATALPDQRIEPKGCTCDSRVLFNGGCKCGWFKTNG